MSDAQEITLLLGQVRENPAMLDNVYKLVQKRLRHIAAACMYGERANHTLQETMLVNDAFQKLVGNNEWEGREQFFCMAARVMRQLLVDHARMKLADKRGGGEAVASLDAVAEPVQHGQSDPQKLVELNDLMEQLEGQHPDAFQVFSLHYFMGWELKEIAETILEKPYITVRRRWDKAKELLREALVEKLEEPV